MNPRGNYIKEEDGDFEQSEISRRDRSGMPRQESKSKFGLRSTLVVNDNSEDVEDVVHI